MAADVVAFASPGPTFIKPDQLDPWIKDQIKITLLAAISSLQLPIFVLCGRDKQGLKLTLIPRSDFLLLLSKSWSKSDRHRSYFLSLKADICLDWAAKFCS